MNLKFVSFNIGEYFRKYLIGVWSLFLNGALLSQIFVNTRSLRCSTSLWHLFPTALAFLGSQFALCRWVLYCIDRRATATPFPWDLTLPTMYWSIVFLMDSAFTSEVLTFLNYFLISDKIQVLRLDSNSHWNNKSMFILHSRLLSSIIIIIS